MRITNKIMQDNALSNINQNKILQDKLSTQMASGKKIQRPSDDPVVAIRALRLRTTLSDITQYRDKNVEDAKSWLKVTEDAIVSIGEALTDMIEQCNSGANEDLKTEDREAILAALKEFRTEIYATGDADYAGRGVFTGYRTGTKLRFEEDSKLTYSITERLDKAIMDDITYVKMDNGKNTIGAINSGNFTDGDFAMEDTAVSQETVHRLRLSYNNLDSDVVPKVTYYDKLGNLKQIPIVTISKYEYEDVLDENGNKIQETDAAGNPVFDPVTGDPVYVKADAYQYASTMKKTEVPVLDADGNPMMDNTQNPPVPLTEQVTTGAVFIPETGELILNDDAYHALSGVSDLYQTDGVDESKISVTYCKTDWQKGELRPEHYFECVEDPYDALHPNGKKNIQHNMDKPKNADDQIISYDVGFNQKVRVNTLASECYTHDIGRDVDDMIAILQQVGDVEEVVKTLDGIIKDPKTTEADRLIAEKSLTAANKAMTFLKEKLQVTFENGISGMQKYLDKTTLALTAVGTRGSKLDLVQTRLDSQKTNFKDLVADNEQANTAEVATDLASAKFAYDASLMATGKITQSTLMNFI